MTKSVDDRQPIHSKKITAESVLDICSMIQTPPEGQHMAVADNAVVIAQVHFSDNSWMRAIEGWV